MDEHMGSVEGFSMGVLAFAFLAGALVGAGAAIMLAPESGAVIRGRLRRGARTAQDELEELAAETREAFGALGKDARQTIKRTATRLNAALGATREAMKAGPGAAKGPWHI